MSTILPLAPIWSHFLLLSMVKTHVNRAMVKVGARDRAQLVVSAYRCGLVC
jgi:DNA-binding NarL/FixJ family response regulator